MGSQVFQPKTTVLEEFANRVAIDIDDQKTFFFDCVQNDVGLEHQAVYLFERIPELAGQEFQGNDQRPVPETDHDFILEDVFQKIEPNQWIIDDELQNVV
jgi:hypothetical protein